MTTNVVIGIIRIKRRNSEIAGIIFINTNLTSSRCTHCVALLNIFKINEIFLFIFLITLKKSFSA